MWFEVKIDTAQRLCMPGFAFGYFVSSSKMTQVEENKDQNNLASNQSVDSCQLLSKFECPQKDEQASAYKKVYQRLKHECASFKKYAFATSASTMVITCMTQGYFHIGELKISLDALLHSASKCLVLTGGALCGIILGAGIAAVLSFLIDTEGMLT